MSKNISESFEHDLGGIEDPRVERTKLHPLSEILLIVLAGAICGAESWRDFVLFGLVANAKQISSAIRSHWLIEIGIYTQ